MNQATVFVVIPVFNRRDDTLRCVACLLRQSYQSTHVIVVDDGSTDGTSDALKTQYPIVTVLRGDGNLWWAGSTNKGVEHALHESSPGDYILTLNNDLTVEPTYIESLVRVASVFPRRTLVGSMAVSNHDSKVVLYCGSHRNWWLGTSRSSVPTVRYGAACYETDALPGRGTLIPFEAFAEVGLFDAKLFPQYFADIDYALRCRKAGYEVVVAKEAVVVSDAEKTGLGSKFHYDRMSWLDAAKSLWSIRSAKHLGKRWRFAIRHCPPLKLPVHLVADTIIVVTSFFRKKYLK